MINEILQWICIATVIFVIVVPRLVQIVRDFRSEDEE